MTSYQAMEVGFGGLLGFNLGSIAGWALRVAWKELDFLTKLILALIPTSIWYFGIENEWRLYCFALLTGFIYGLFKGLGTAPTTMISFIATGLFIMLTEPLNPSSHLAFLVSCLILGTFLAALGHLRERSDRQLALPIILYLVTGEVGWQFVITADFDEILGFVSLVVGTILGAFDWLRINSPINSGTED